MKKNAIVRVVAAAASLVAVLLAGGAGFGIG